MSECMLLECKAANEQKGQTPTVNVFPSRAAELGGGLQIRRALPIRNKRMISAWCFLDHFGPLDFGSRKAIDVAAHPHIGLQTVTWVLEGEVLHKDNLNYTQVIRPGQCNIMTAGRGISHSEETPPESSGRIHGVQFWVALPEKDRHCEPAFQHIADVPQKRLGQMDIQLVVGEALGMRSAAPIYWPIVGMDVNLTQAGQHQLPLESGFEYGVMVLEGAFQAEGQAFEIGNLYDLGVGRDQITFENDKPARLMLIGGKPFDEKILMWWNFVARTHEELQQASQDWQSGDRFGEVSAYSGGRLTVPELQYRQS